MVESILQVAIIMGSKSDWDTMRLASETLTKLQVTHESRVLSAHRAPDALVEYISQAEGRGVQVFIAGAGGAAHLAGVIAAKTQLPVLGVPMQSKALQGLDSLCGHPCPLIDCPNAQRHPSGDSGDWERRCGECGVIGCGYPGFGRFISIQAVAGLPTGTNSCCVGRAAVSVVRESLGVS